MTTVQGTCPMGCGHTLILGMGGYVTCGYLSCPNPTRADEMLDDAEYLQALFELSRTLTPTERRQALREPTLAPAPRERLANFTRGARDE